MLKLGLVRHAKSSWGSPELTDHDRPLNKRGIRDAPVMAEKVKTLLGIPDILISSTAKRAITTAKVFREALNLDKKQLLTTSKLYHAMEEDVMNRIALIDESVKFALFFGHNPTTTFMANSFMGDMIDNVPTCGVVYLESESSSWAELDYNNTRVVSFLYPKLYV